jgi:sugar phosphate isomerase/epimerase
MRKPLDEFAQPGINHHLLFPASMSDEAAHEQTLPRALALDGFEVIDLFVPPAGAGRRKREIELIRRSGKTVVYNIPLLLTGGHSPSSTDAAVRRRTLEAVRPHVEAMLAVGARKACIASGPDPLEEAARSAEKEAFCEFLCELCDMTGETHILIEPFDRSIGKNLLIGPAREAADIVRRVRSAGRLNVGVLLDMGHLPLMGESFAQALSGCGQFVEHVHLGNCVKRNPSSPYYGDMHPPLGAPDGEHDEPETTAFLSELVKAGYLPRGPLPPGKPRAILPTLTIETRPCPDRTEEESAALMLAKVKRAWERV